MVRPVYQITARISKDLMAIEAARQRVEGLPIDMKMLSRLRESARLLATHHSTRIEGNRLNRTQVAAVVSGGRIPDRERDESEVRNYYAALGMVERRPRPIVMTRT